jgi:hypothetical protein
MNSHQYYVMHDGRGWLIQSDGENSEAFLSRQEAIQGAVALAHLDETNGRDAAVIAQDDDAIFRPYWRAGVDPYPLSG